MKIPFRRLRLRLLRALLRVVPARLLGIVWHNPLFDTAWYLAEYPDVRRAGVAAELHYRRHGVGELRQPNAVFDTHWYITRYPDVARGRLSPLDHYYLFGAHEGRDPSGRFDTDWYEHSSPDVALSGMNPLLHYLRHGQAEGRATEPSSTPAHIPGEGGRRLLLVVHDAHDHGAQRLALHLARSLCANFKIRLDIVLLRGGALREEFERWGRVHAVGGHPDSTLAALFSRLRAAGVDTAICNTTVSGRLTSLLKDGGYRVLALVHELPQLIRDYHLESAATEVARRADAVVFASAAVRDAFAGIAGDMGPRAHVRPQGLYREETRIADTEPSTRATVWAELGLPAGSPLVLAVGFADRRKGFDLFLEACERIHRAVPEATFVWLGCEDPELIRQASHSASRSGLDKALRLLPRVPDVDRYYDVASLLLVPSREDPYPSVVLEALSHGLPVVAFEQGNGAAQLIARGCGVVVPGRDVDALADATARLLRDEPTRTAMGARGREIVATEFKWLDYVYDLLALAGQPFRKVSVVVPNFNYAHHLERRLASIFGQTYPVREVIVLDDASTDASLAVLAELGNRDGWSFEVVGSTTNSGSVFRQWQKGVSAARGELVWIAEADDFAEPEFLERLVPAFDEPRMVMAYSESRQVDAAGRVMADSYIDYVRDIDPTKWTSSWSSSGPDELAESFAIRNVVPNVSAVLFERASLLRALNEQLDFITTFKVAGDYAVYVRMLLDGGRIAFVSEPLNNHRRHPGGVTISSFGRNLITEIASMQGFVRDHVPVSDEVRRQADDYLKSLEAQFGVAAASEVS